MLRPCLSHLHVMCAVCVALHHRCVYGAPAHLSAIMAAMGRLLMGCGLACLVDAPLGGLLVGCCHGGPRALAGWAQGLVPGTGKVFQGMRLASSWDLAACTDAPAPLLPGLSCLTTFVPQRVACSAGLVW
jgi:hypothetical protein